MDATAAAVDRSVALFGVSIFLPPTIHGGPSLRLYLPRPVMPNLPKTCTNCGGQSLFVTMVSAAGGYGSNFLPELGGFFHGAKFQVVLCEDCGHTAFFADKDARQKARNNYKWYPL